MTRTVNSRASLGGMGAQDCAATPREGQGAPRVLAPNWRGWMAVNPEPRNGQAGVRDSRTHGWGGRLGLKKSCPPAAGGRVGNPQIQNPCRAAT